MGPIPEGVGGPAASRLHSQARFLVCTLWGSSCVYVVDLFLSCTCVCPTGFFVSLVCTLRGFFVSFFVYTTELFVGVHWFPPCRGGSAGPSLRVAGTDLRVAGCAGVNLC